MSRLKHGIAEWLACVFLEYAVDRGSRDKRHPSTLPTSILVASDDFVSPAHLFGKVRSNYEGLVVVFNCLIDELAWTTLFFQHIIDGQCSAEGCSSRRHVCHQ